MQFDRSERDRHSRQVCWLPVESITPRPSVEAEGADSLPLGDLARSIAQHGLIRPITVQKTNAGRYMVVSGNRRFMACRLAGLTHVDAVILEGMTVEPDARRLLEMILSGRMHYLEEAGALNQLTLRHSFSRDDLARCLGRTAAAINQRLRLTELDEDVTSLLLEHNLPEGVARALLKLPDRRARMNIVRQAVRDHLGVRDVELLVSSAMARLPVPPVNAGRTITLVRDHRLYLNAIRSIIAQMQEAGVPATAEEHTLDDRVEVVLHLPTRRRRARGNSGAANI